MQLTSEKYVSFRLHTPLVYTHLVSETARVRWPGGAPLLRQGRCRGGSSLYQIRHSLLSDLVMSESLTGYAGCLLPQSILLCLFTSCCSLVAVIKIATWLDQAYYS